ncbi:hypothetical protein [Methylobacterium isbiliense]|jgi:hypothetical protein|uniref:Transposase n=1 Tax=Methylobacterium isbiliense TaxID=315478 RepID=A0ABQ4SEB6_9HYPH|nr:hypothetical protein [Methylobacterium isbiliense]MDN3626108.1 hypothetical protein [Methylobacterium isbiliense]GJE00263.1 hypothetical protein GMJLKIPL_2183 [Methylobacterium isbiliense]
MHGLLGLYNAKHLTDDLTAAVLASPCAIENPAREGKNEGRHQRKRDLTAA